MLFIQWHEKYIQDFTLNFDLNDPGENDINYIIPMRRVSEKNGFGPENTSMLKGSTLRTISIFFKKKFFDATFIINNVKIFSQKMLDFSFFSQLPIISLFCLPHKLFPLKNLHKIRVQAACIAGYIKYCFFLSKILKYSPGSGLSRFSSVVYTDDIMAGRTPVLQQNW